MTDRELMQEVLEALETCGEDEWYSDDDFGMMQVYDEEKIIKAIAVLRKRLAQPEQEPVAWRWKERINGDFDSWVISASEPPPYAIKQQPLYTITPQRQWQGLARLEFQKAVEGLEDLEDCWIAIESALREKNT